METSEPQVLGQSVHLLPEARLEVAKALKAEMAADAMTGVQRAIATALEAVSLAEILRYEQNRRRASTGGTVVPCKIAVTLLPMKRGATPVVEVSITDSNTGEPLTSLTTLRVKDTATISAFYRKDASP